MTATARAALVAVAVVVADQAVKALVRSTIDRGDAVSLFLRIRLVNVRNDGIAFGAFAGGGAVLVIFALAGWAASTLIGVLFLGPEASRLGKLMPTRPPEDPEIQQRIRRILMIVRVDVVLLLVIVFVMTAKPFL